MCGVAPPLHQGNAQAHTRLESSPRHGQVCEDSVDFSEVSGSELWGWPDGAPALQIL
jgi:hypothetical protein